MSDANGQTTVSKAEPDKLGEDIFLASQEIRMQIFESLKKITLRYPDKHFAFNGRCVKEIEEIGEEI